MTKPLRLYTYGMLLTAGLILIISCSEKRVRGDEQGLSENQKKTIEYFKEIALGFEFGGGAEEIKKWDHEMIVFVGGEENETLRNELNTIISDLNGLITADSVWVSITTDSTESNFYLYFGRGEDYAEIIEEAGEYIDENYGLFFVDWNTHSITDGTMYVDTERPAAKNQRHLLREEFTQSFGLAKDSPRYSDSIFNSDYSVDVTEYSAMDKAIIELLYRPEIQFGMEEAQVDSVLQEIIAEVVD